jgi:tRNA U54 and U55 pseudouridine synthase Pus10
VCVCVCVCEYPTYLCTSHQKQVQSLQHVPRRIFDEIIEGEGEKQKTYRCVVWVSEALNETVLKEKLESLNDLVVQQVCVI